MAVGSVEAAVEKTKTELEFERIQKSHDDWNKKIAETMASLQATRESVQSTMKSIDRTVEVNRDAGESLKKSRQSMEKRLSAAKASLDFATEQIAFSLGDPSATSMLMNQTSAFMHGGGNSTARPIGNSTAGAGGVELEDIARCGRGLSQLGSAGGFGGSEEDADLQRALAESMQTSTLATAQPAKLDPIEDEDEELRRAIAASLEPPASALAPAGKPASLPQSASRPQTPLDPLRQQVAHRLHNKSFMGPDDPLFMHGRAYQGPIDTPTKIWESEEAPRSDHEAPEWLTASEFEDSAEVARAKVKQLAELMHLSKKTVLYTGAGISASVIGQAARSGENKVGWKTNLREAQPTPTHIALGILGREGMVHSWVQQNHDGLPQKAGFPQENINEIHGSWFDPSNPVVKYSGSLHQKAAPWMVKDAETADLVIVLGTSLSGLNADQVVHKTSVRSLLPPPPPEGVFAAGAHIMAAPPGFQFMHKGVVSAVLDDGDFLVDFEGYPDGPTLLSAGSPIELLPPVRPALGTVCINLQQTKRDGEMSLRLFGKSDTLLQMLLKELGFSMQKLEPPTWPKDSRVLVPYDSDGRRLVDPKAKQMWLDLRKGQKVRISSDHNIQGAKQPAYMHIGASEPFTCGGETRQPAIGLGHVVEREEASSSFTLQIEGVSMRLGVWWLEAAMRGAVDVLPVINQNPLFEGTEACIEPTPAAKAFAKPSAGGPRRGAARVSTPPCSAKRSNSRPTSA